MAHRDPFVAKVSIQLKYSFESSHQKALQKQLWRHAKIQIHIQGIVMGYERTRRRAPGNPLHHRRFHFQEIPFLEKAPQETHDARTFLEKISHFRIDHQIDVPLAIARLNVGKTVPLFGQGSQALGQQPQPLGFDRQFLGLRAKEAAPDSDNVAHIQGLKQSITLISELVLSRVYLDPSPPILDVKERRLPHFAHSHDPARYLELGGEVGQPLVTQTAELSENISGRMTWSKIVGVQRIACLFEVGELLPAHLNLLKGRFWRIVL